MRHSKDRVRKYGEVFTPEWLVKKMCDEVSSDYYDATHTFLEPSCGTGNFIVEVLTRKMSSIADVTSKKSQYLRLSCQVLSTIYGVELLHDNILDCRKRVYSHWKSLCLFEPDETVLAVARSIIKTNLIWGDFIKKINLKTGQPLSFIEYKWDGSEVTLSSYKMEDMQNTISFNVPCVRLGTCNYKDLPKCLTQ